MNSDDEEKEEQKFAATATTAAPTSITMDRGGDTPVKQQSTSATTTTGQSISTNGTKRRSAALGDDDDDDERNAKKQRVAASATAAVDGEDTTINTSSSLSNSNNNIAEVAKTSRLSKWAARLFDPDRPRSLIETPRVIPLNDEFLKAFGQREKAHDAALGRDQLDVEKEIIDNSDNEDKDNGDLYADVAGEDKKPQATTTTTAPSNKSGCKIKISNIKYTTTAATLEAACRRFGPVATVTLIMSKDSDYSNNAPGTTAENAGRAFVTFEDATDATACMEGLQSLDGRPLRIDPAADKAPRSSSGGGGGGAGGGSGPPSRYWEAEKRNLSIKCFKCGGVGHMEAECENDAQIKPCPLCAQKRDGHTIRNCPIKAVCYNCGIPGHVSRDCRQPRQHYLPPRRICTICYQVGDHTKELCRRGISGAQSYNAECMVCGERGHHLCREMKWQTAITAGHGGGGGGEHLQGISCSNCGQAGHVGSMCAQPKWDDCSRDEALAIHQVELATKYYTEEQQRQARERAMHQNNNSNGGRRGRTGGRGGRASLDGGGGGQQHQQRNYQQQQQQQQSPSRGRQAQQDFEFDRRRNRSMPPMRNAPPQQQQQQQKQPPGGGGGQRRNRWGGRK